MKHPYGSTVGVWENPTEYVGELVYYDGGPWGCPPQWGRVVSKDPFITTKKVTRNDKPCWTVEFNDGSSLWYRRDQIEALLAAARTRTPP